MHSSPSPSQVKRKATWVLIEQRSFDVDSVNLEPIEAQKLFEGVTLSLDKLLRSVGIEPRTKTVVFVRPRIIVLIALTDPVQISLRLSAHFQKHPIRTLSARLGRMLEKLTEP